MVMDRINGFPNLNKDLLDRFQGAGRADAPDGEHTANVGAPGQERRAAPTDTADISPKAHRLIALRNAIDYGRQALEGLPEVRQDRMAQVRERLHRGFYNSVEVRALVAERLDELTRMMEDL